MLKKILWVLLAIVITLVGLVITFVGPWPTYASSGFRNASYFKNAVAAIDRAGARADITPQPGRLQAGWAKAKLTPAIGTPLAGYGDRHGKPSTGVHDDIYVKALALSDGVDKVVIVGSDILIVPENVAEQVRVEVAKQTDLTGNDILFNSSHTHSGLGGWGPGFIAEQFGGAYNPEIVTALTREFTDAIVQARNALEPAELAHGGVDAPQYIRNRTREAPTDSGLSFLVVRQQDGDRCYVVSYSAHPTVLGGDNMEFSADFAGYLQRTIEKETGGFAEYLGGAVGSSGPRAPDAPDGFARAEAMGVGLAKMVLDASAQASFEQNVEIATIGIPLELPPFQVRLTRNWRLSPFLPGIMGIDADAWLEGVRIGKVLMFGLPCDLNAEISLSFKKWGAEKGYDVWPLGFNGDYLGYLSPDKYYTSAKNKGMEGYEMYLMSWIGPDQEAYFAALVERIGDTLIRPPAAGS